jgi:hypothetical protein
MATQLLTRLSSRSILIWRIVQILVWLVGVTILFFLIFFPEIGIHMFWNVLIPVAPLLLVVGTGIWRNVCPMASTALFPRHMGFSKKKKLNITQTGKLNLISIVLLFLIVPLRHAIFDTSGMATAILILSLGAIAFIAGTIYEWKSAWCSGLCPVHPVEKMYGLNNQLRVPNAHCDECRRCITPCPDSTDNIDPLTTKKTTFHSMAGILTVGGLPGFIYGWFQVPDYAGIAGWEQLISIYTPPMLGLAVTLVLFVLLKRIFKERTIIEFYSAIAVSCYYWFRLPALFGFGKFSSDGMLVDLSSVIHAWSIQGVVYALTLFFFWWIIIRKKTSVSWAVRPVFAEDKT